MQPLDAANRCPLARYEGYKTLVTAKGLGSLRPNTVMLGWPHEELGALPAADKQAFCDLLKWDELPRASIG